MSRETFGPFLTKMKVSRIYLIVILLLVFGVNVNSQEPPKPILQDEFGKLSCCCDLSGRIDMLLQELSRTPDSVGYVVLGDSRTSTQLRRERYFDGTSGTVVLTKIE